MPCTSTIIPLNPPQETIIRPYAELGAIPGSARTQFYTVRGRGHRGHNIFHAAGSLTGTKFCDHPQAAIIDPHLHQFGAVVDEQARLLNSVVKWSQSA